MAGAATFRYIAQFVLTVEYLAVEYQIAGTLLSSSVAMWVVRTLVAFIVAVVIGHY